MKHIIPTALAIGALTLSPARAQDCVNADPTSVLATVGGDFEFTVDPQDPAQNLIFTANVADGASQIVAAKFDGVTGQVVAGSLTTIADNFYGYKTINGPEFVQAPTGELGVVYAGRGGVHAVFRPADPPAWNAFRFDVAGKRTLGSPPLLPSTSNGAYPAPPIPLGQRTYGQYKGACLGVCFGPLDGGVITDAKAVLAGMGLAASAGVQSPTDGYIFFSACDPQSYCGIYEAQIDGAGGFAANTLQKLAATGSVSSVSMVAARHPVNGSTIVFSNDGTTAVDVWEQAAEGGALRLVKQVQVASGDTHFRAETDTYEVLLHYLIKSGPGAGSYTVPVIAPGNVLDVGPSKKISDHGSGAELVWLPAAAKWAVFYRSDANTLRRCWITP
jgi:hypothetical protein